MITKNTIKEFRKKEGLTQVKLANLCNVTVDAVRKWESGERAVKGPAELVLTQLIGGNMFTDFVDIKDVGKMSGQCWIVFGKIMVMAWRDEDGEFWASRYGSPRFPIEHIKKVKVVNQPNFPE